MLRSSNMIKHIIASGGGSLEAKAGTALLVRRISCVASTNDTYLKVIVGNATVGYFRVKGKAGNHISPMIGGYLHDNLWDRLMAAGVNMSIPIAEGQKLEVERYAEAGNVFIEYEEYDPSDISNDQENGSNAITRTLINYMGITTALTATGDAAFDKNLGPSEFPDFPAAGRVPANHRIKFLGLVGSPWCDGAGGPIYFVTDKIKIFQGVELLFDTDRNGLPFKGDVSPGTALEYNSAYSLIGPSVPVLLDSATIGNGGPLLFDNPPVFNEGDVLDIKVTCTKSGAHTWTADVEDLAAIIEVTRL